MIIQYIYVLQTPDQSAHFDPLSPCTRSTDGLPTPSLTFCCHHCSSPKPTAREIHAPSQARANLMRHLLIWRFDLNFPLLEVSKLHLSPLSINARLRSLLVGANTIYVKKKKAPLSISTGTKIFIKQFKAIIYGTSFMCSNSLCG